MASIDREFEDRLFKANRALMRFNVQSIHELIKEKEELLGTKNPSKEDLDRIDDRIRTLIDRMNWRTVT